MPRSPHFYEFPRGFGVGESWTTFVLKVFFFFLMWPIFKVFIELVTILLLLHVLFFF